jgi:hypothetical protein
MGAAVGGDLLEGTFNHPTLGTGIFYYKANEDSTFDLGGIRSEDDQDMIDGAGQMIDKMNRKRWEVEGTIAWDMQSDLTLEKLVQLSESPVQADYTFQHVNGTVYGGKGKPVGDLKGAGNQATISTKFSGGGKLKKIS